MSDALTEAEVRSVVEPDINPKTFVFGKNPDGTPRNWKIKPLPWKYEKQFRAQVMPMLAVAYKPFENLLSALVGRGTGAQEPLFDSVFAADTKIDDFLVNSVHVVLLAQDSTITTQWVEDNAQSREELIDIIEKYCELHRILDRLGELLAGRFGKLVKMIGLDINSDTLKQLWKQLSEALSARTMQIVSTVDNATGLFTENLSETTSQIPNGMIRPVAYVGTPQQRP